jgi:hypothetical protein
VRCFSAGVFGKEVRSLSSKSSKAMLGSAKLFELKAHSSISLMINCDMAFSSNQALQVIILVALILVKRHEILQT